MRRKKPKKIRSLDEEYRAAGENPNIRAASDTDWPITAEGISNALADYARSSQPIAGEILAEILLDQEWLMAGQLPPRYRSQKGKQSVATPDKRRLWRDACLYNKLCEKGIIEDRSPAETIAEQFGCTKGHVSRNILTNRLYQPTNDRITYFLNQYGKEGAARITKILMTKSGELFREMH